MQIMKLEVERRDKVGSAEARRLRRSGRIPVSLYGLGREPANLSVDGQTMSLEFARGNRMFELAMGGNKQLCLIKDIQYTAVGEKILHMDLWRVESGEAVTITVPLVFVGAPEAASGATLDHPMHEIEVSCLPADIPRALEISVASMAVGDHLTAKDVALPEGLTLMTDGDQTIASYHYKAVEAEPVEEEEAAEPEVVGRPAATDDDEGDA